MLGERLRYAREQSGLTLRQVVERSGIGESSLSEYEHGKRDPRVSQLQVLAKIYNRPLSFLMGEGPIPREQVLWREQPEQAVAAEIAGRFRLLAEQYNILEQLCGAARPVRLMPAMSGDVVEGFEGARNLARCVCRQLQLGDRPGLTLLRVLEEACGVKIFHMAFEPSGAAACSVSPTFGAAVLLNVRHTRWRRNFDLAHELYHILTWDHFRSTGNDSASDDEEKWANAFAGALLLPGDALRSSLAGVVREGQVRFGELAGVCREFDVSVDALVWRMVDLRRLSAEQAGQLLERYKASRDSWERGFDEESPPPEWPERFRALAIRALRDGQLSIGRYAEYTGISRSRAMRIAAEEALDDEPIEVGDS